MRNGLTYDDIRLWEIRETFAAQVLFHIKALESADFCAGRLASRPPSEPSHASA
jgi:acetyl-CoA C-acetyltransferase